MPIANDQDQELVRSVETNSSIISSAPSAASAISFQTLAHAVSVAMENAAFNQQQLNVFNTAATGSCVDYLLGHRTASSNDKPSKKQQS